MKSFVETTLVAIAAGVFVWVNSFFPYKASDAIGSLNYIYEDARNHGALKDLKTEITTHYEFLHANPDSNPFAANHKLLEEIEIREEERLGQMELLAQLIEAEAGNQDLKGKRLVADVVINRAYERDLDPTNAVETIIFEDGQFSCIKDGGFDRAGWTVSEESFMAAEMEYENYYKRENLLDRNVYFFTAGYYNPYCTPMYKYGAHYFGM